MTRENKTTVELQTLIQDKIINSNKSDGDCREYKYHKISITPTDDDDGCNWEVRYIPTSGPCFNVILNIINECRQQYNLKD